MNGAQAMTECLKKEKVKYIFGYPGAAIAPFYDELSRCSEIKHILVRQEQNAGHAASGYARASGKVGVCCATSGPGAVNLISALATAYMDSIPIVAITGQVRTDLVGRDVFQEADIIGACEPFTKHSCLVKNADDIPRIFKEAFYIAATGRPGPVLIDMPVDVQQTELQKDFEYPQRVDIPGYKPRLQGHPLQIKRAVSALASAEKPLICAGGGVVSAQARKELVSLAEKLDIPVVSTLMGVGIMPTDHRLYCGMLGSHGKKSANAALQRADCVMLCGARVGDRAMAAADQIASHATIIHIDIDTAEIGKNMRADIPIVGDVRTVLKSINEDSQETRHENWLNEIGELKSTPYVTAKNCTEGIDPGEFMRILSKEAGKRGKAIVVADVGQNQIWAANNFEFSGGRFLTSGGMGTMGYSLPAAIGAKLAKPEREVIAVCGDGGYMMLLPELSTAAANGVSVKLVVMNNDGLGMIRELQDRLYDGRRFALSLGSTDYTLAAQAMGTKAKKLYSMNDAFDCIGEMLDSKDTFVLECMVSPEMRSV